MVAVLARTPSISDVAWLDYDITSVTVEQRHMDSQLRALLDQQRERRIQACGTCGTPAEDRCCTGCGLKDRVNACAHDADNHRVTVAIGHGAAFCTGCWLSGAADAHLRWLRGEGSK